MLTKVQELEKTVDTDSTKINTLASRQALEKSENGKGSLETMHQLLSVAERQLQVSEESRDILSEQLQFHKKIAKFTEDTKYVVPSHSRRSSAPYLTPK